MSGRSITNACFKAARTNSGANSGLMRRGAARRRSTFTAIAVGLLSCRVCCEHLPFSSKLPRNTHVLFARSAAERDRAKCSASGPSAATGKKQQSADDHDCAEQKTPESKRIVAQCSEAEGRFLFVSERRRHRDRSDDRQIAAEKHHQTGGYIPRPGFRSRTRIVVEAISHSQSIEGRAVVRGRG